MNDEQTSPRADAVRVRLPQSMHDRLRVMALSEGITVNALMIALLSRAMKYDPFPDAPARPDEADEPGVDLTQHQTDERRLA
jgi:hypothetical protein